MHAHQATDTLPIAMMAAGHIQPPMFQILAFITLSAGAVADSPHLIANGSNLLAEIGLSDMEQFGIRGLLTAALCYVFKLLVSYHKDSLRRADEQAKQLRIERDQLIERIRQMNKERDDELKRWRDGQ